MRPVKDDDRAHNNRVLQWTKECEMMLTLSHPNIVQVFEAPADVVKIADSPFSLLAMEYCPDGDLRKVLCQDS